MREALVVGSGPAGLLASRVLADRGFRVTLATRERDTATPQPSWHHVHLMSSATLERIEMLVPGIAAYWPRDGGKRRLDRAELDHALAAACLPAVAGRTVAGPFTMNWGGEIATATWHDGTTWHGDIVVDASGAARATCQAIARRLGRPIPMDSLAGSGRYTSAVLHGVTVPSDDGFLAVRAAERGTGALLLALHDGSARITVQTPANVRLTTAAELRTVWEGLGSAELTAACEAAVGAGPLARWGPHPTMRVVLEECDDAPSGWLPVGDALLITLPHLGRGVAHLVEQVGLLQTLRPDRSNAPQVRASLGELSAARWADAAMLEGLAALQWV